MGILAFFSHRLLPSLTCWSTAKFFTLDQFTFQVAQQMLVTLEIQIAGGSLSVVSSASPELFSIKLFPVWGRKHSWNQQLPLDNSIKYLKFLIIKTFRKIKKDNQTQEPTKKKKKASPLLISALHIKVTERHHHCVCIFSYCLNTCNLEQSLLP